jgi:hypothetical protein
MILLDELLFPPRVFDYVNWDFMVLNLLTSLLLFIELLFASKVFALLSPLGISVGLLIPCLEFYFSKEDPPIVVYFLRTLVYYF